MSTSPLNPLSFGTGLTPIPSLTSIPSGGLGGLHGVGSSSGPAGGVQTGDGRSIRTGDKGDKAESSIEEVKKGLQDFSMLLDRAMSTLEEIRRVESGLFDKAEGRSEGMQIGMGGLTKLERESPSLALL